VSYSQNNERASTLETFIGPKITQQDWTGIYKESNGRAYTDAAVFVCNKLSEICQLEVRSRKGGQVRYSPKRELHVQGKGREFTDGLTCRKSLHLEILAIINGFLAS
jgi:hypothetical protein